MMTVYLHVIPGEDDLEEDSSSSQSSQGIYVCVYACIYMYIYICINMSLYKHNVNISIHHRNTYVHMFTYHYVIFLYKNMSLTMRGKVVKEL
jgi:hypothetical protein